MLNFKNTLILSAIALAITGVTDILIPVSLWWYIGIVLALFLLLTWGAISIRSDFYLHSVCSGDRNARAVALTFDDGPDGLITPMILDILKENKVRAAFFIVGSKAEKHPEIIKRIDAEGHILGGHSYSHHFLFDLFSFKKMGVELKQTSALIYKFTGKKMRLFRPPYSVTNPTVARVVRNMNYCAVGWSLKSNDTVLKDGSVLLNNVISNLNKGDIILFHDNKPWVVSMLGTFIHYLKDKEYTIDRLDNFINTNAYVN